MASDVPVMMTADQVMKAKRLQEQAIENCSRRQQAALEPLNWHGLSLPEARLHGQCPDCLMERLLVCPECSRLIKLSDQRGSKQHFDISWWRDAPNPESELIDGADQQFARLFGLESAPETLGDLLFAKTHCQKVVWFDGQPGKPFEAGESLFIQFHDESGFKVDAYQVGCPQCAVQMVDVLIFPYINWGMK